MTEKLKFVLGRVEDIVGKEENVGVTSVFSFSQNVVKSPALQGHLKSGLCGKELMEQEQVKSLVWVKVKKKFGQMKKLLSLIAVLKWFENVVDNRGCTGVWII